MWTCIPCLKQASKKVPKNLLIRTCNVCHTPAVECAIEQTKVNIEAPNWHKSSEGKDCLSTPEPFQIPENGLYLWLRPQH